MCKFFALVLLSALAAVGARKIIINSHFDSFFQYINEKQRQVGSTSAALPEILDSKVKYSHGVFLGVDSLKRTGDCWMEKKRKDITFDVSYGFGLMTVVLPHLEIAGTNMSAYARIRDNSAHVSYTLSNVSGKDCHAKLNEFRVERMENVEFAASRPEYDGSDMDGFFKSVVIPTLNGIVESNFEKIEASLQELCKTKDFQNLGNFHEHAMSFLY